MIETEVFETAELPVVVATARKVRQLSVREFVEEVQRVFEFWKNERIPGSMDSVLPRGKGYWFFGKGHRKYGYAMRIKCRRYRRSEG